MATHSSILAWRIPLSEEPGGLQSIGSERFRHDWVTEHTNNDYSPFKDICILYPKICADITLYGTPLVAQMVNNLPAMHENRVWSLGWEDPLEKGMAAKGLCRCSSIRIFRWEDYSEFYRGAQCNPMCPKTGKLEDLRYRKRDWGMPHWRL